MMRWDVISELIKDERQGLSMLGVEVGLNQAAMAHRLMRLRPTLGLLSVDPYPPGWHNNKSLEKMQGAVRQMLFYPGWRFLPLPSIEVAEKWSKTTWPDPFFVFIDGLHDYDSVKADIEAWWPLIAEDGFLSGHDYGRGGRKKNEGWGVKKAVHEFAEAHGREVELYDDAVWVIRRTA